MTDLPNSAADQAADAPTPAIETPAGDPELAALVRRDAGPDDADPSPAAEDDSPGVRGRRSGRRHARAGGGCRARARGGRHRACRRCRAGPAPRGRRDRRRALGTASAPTVARPPLRRLVRPGLPARRRHRRRRPVRMGPAVRRPGPARRPRRQHGTRRAHPRAGGGGRSRTPMGRSAPGRSRSPARTARRRPSATPTSAAAPTPRRSLDAALAAGRQGEPLANLIGAPQAAIHGVTLDSAVAYDRDKLAAAVETLATTIDQTPVDATVSAGQGGTFSVSPAKDGRAVDKAALLTALDQQLAALGTPASITMAVPVVSLAPAVATAIGRGGEGGRGSNGRRRGRHPGQGQLDDRRHEPRAADLVLDRGRRDASPRSSTSRASTRSSRRWPRRSTRPRRTRASSWSADTSSPPAPAARAERSTLPA